MTLDSIGKWVALFSTAWVIASSILNWFFWFKTPEDWVAFAEEKPRGAAFIRLVRSSGLDPRKALIALRDLAATNPRAKGPPGTRGVPVTPSDAPPGGLYLDPQTDRVERKDPLS